MGIFAILHWHNAPAINPNGLQLIQQRIIDQYGHNQSQSAWNIQIRTHRPGIAPANQVEQKQPEILTTVAFPRSSTVYEQDVVYSIITYIVPGQNGTSNHPNTNGMPLSREWEIQKDPTYQAFIDRMKSNHSPFLLPPTVAKEGEFRNVANMTAATSHRQAKHGPGGQQAGQTVLTSGHTLSIEGVQIELDLNPGSKSAGLGGQAEWVIRMGWVGGAPNPLSTGSGQGSTKGIIVEVEYVPLLSMPHDKTQQNPLDVPVILSTFLSSLLPLQSVSPPPQVTVLTSGPQEWESIGVNVQTSECIPRSSGSDQDQADAVGPPGTRWEKDERVRRATWTLVKHLKSIGMIA